MVFHNFIEKAMVFVITINIYKNKYLLIINV